MMTCVVFLLSIHIYHLYSQSKMPSAGFQICARYCGCDQAEIEFRYRAYGLHIYTCKVFFRPWKPITIILFNLRTKLWCDPIFGARRTFPSCKNQQRNTILHTIMLGSSIWWGSEAIMLGSSIWWCSESIMLGSSICWCSEAIMLGSSICWCSEAIMLGSSIWWCSEAIMHGSSIWWCSEAIECSAVAYDTVLRQLCSAVAYDDVLRQSYLAVAYEDVLRQNKMNYINISNKQIEKHYNIISGVEFYILCCNLKDCSTLIFHYKHDI